MINKSAAAKHTSGLLRVDPDDRPDMEWNNHIVSVDHPHMTICFMSHDGTRENEQGEANAARLVACWNACEGISTEQLQGNPWAEFGPLCDQRNSLQTECAELRAANAKLVSALQGIFAQTAKHSRQWGQAAGAHAFASDPDTAKTFANARAALQSAGKAE